MTDSKKVISIPKSPPKMVLLNCKIDLTKMCRTCGNKCISSVSLSKAFKTTDVDIKISKMLTMCTNLKVQLGDGLPMIICFNCMDELIRVFNFIRKCKYTDDNMRKYIFNDDKSTKICDVFNNDIINNEIYNDDECNDMYLDDSHDVEETNVKIKKKKVVRKKNPVEVIESLLLKTDLLNDEELQMDLANKDVNIIINERNDLINSETSNIEERRNVDIEEVKLECDYEIEEVSLNNYDISINEDGGYSNKDNLTVEEPVKNIFSEENKRSLYAWKKKCKYCNRNFIQLDAYKTHIKLHAGILPFKCKYCPDRIYATSGRLREHIKLKHSDLNCLDYKCKRSDCGQLFNTFKELRQHSNSHVKNHYECKQCGQTFTYRKGFNTHAKMHLGIKEEFPCEICGKIMATQSSLYLHRRRHNKAYSELCTLCGKGFLTPIELKNHNMAAHSEEKLYQCEVCGKGLKSLSSLNFHRLAFHVKVKTVFCQLCPRKFFKIGQLNQHMKRHNKEYKYSCDKCDHKFYIKKELDIHLLYHSGERPYKCSKCPKTYARPQLYRLHMARHGKPLIQCDICLCFFKHHDFDKHRQGHDNRKKREHEYVVMADENSEGLKIEEEGLEET